MKAITCVISPWTKMMNRCRRKIFACVTIFCRPNRKRWFSRLFSLRTLLCVGIGFIALCGFFFSSQFFALNKPSKYSNSDTRESDGNTATNINEGYHHTGFIPNIYSSCSQLNFSFSSAIFEPVLSSQESRSPLFVLITSGVGHGRIESFSARRAAIRRTWLRHDKNSSLRTWRHAFLIGRGDHPKVDAKIKREAESYHDILQFNITDNYQNLIIKVLSGFRWVFMRATPRYILKADDDVYIRLPHLMRWLNEFGMDQFYGGVVNVAGWFKKQGPSVRRQLDSQLNSVTLDCFGRDHFPPYSAGPFYVLSSNMIPYLFTNIRQWKVFPVEDAYMGVLAKASGLSPVDIPGFKFVYKVNNLISFHHCTWARVVALGHNFSTPHLHYIHTKLKETDKLNLSSNFHWCLAHESLIIYSPFIFLATVVILLLCLAQLSRK